MCPATLEAAGVIDIPMPNPTAEDRLRSAWQDHGLKLARQEDWDKISGLLHCADARRKLTPGGMSVADLIAFGARADVVGAVEHALAEDEDRTSAVPLRAGIAALETVHAERKGDPMIAAVVARAHLDIAQAWAAIAQVWRTGSDMTAATGPGTASGTASRLATASAVSAAHRDRAADILAPFASARRDTPLVLRTHCALLKGSGASPDCVAAAFETLIDLSPMDTRHMRALGTSLLPRWNGDYERLELEARRTAARHMQIWGAGGYAWVMLDAIAADPEACARLDVDYFLDGLRDILALRPDQATVNLLAAYASVTMAPETGQSAADRTRARIRDASGWIVCDYMTELHPVPWACAAQGVDVAPRLRALDGFARGGAAKAREVLSGLFLRELARGQSVVFTENGPRLETAPV